MSKVRHADRACRYLLKGFVALGCLATMSVTSGCNIVPNDGPLSSEVVRAGSKSSDYAIPKTNITFDVVNVDQRIANSVTTLGQPSFVATFGTGGAAGVPVIGVGDVLIVTIFEAGPDGLFSTESRKSTEIPVVIQPDGRGQIPYVGPIRFVGLTLEQARSAIVDSLKAKAVEPDVVVNMKESVSRTVSVLGAVGRPSVIPLGLSAQHVTDILAEAGGPVKPAYESYVTLTRGKKSNTILLQALFDNAADNVYVRPGDQLVVTYEPQTFTVLGSSVRSGKIPFDAAGLSLVEAAALSGGSNAQLADPRGYFVFRYEYEAVYRQVVGEDRFRELVRNGLQADREGLYPIVYRIDMSDPQSYLVTQSFPIRNKDVLYLSRHPATDYIKFMQIVSASASLYKTAKQIEDLSD